MRQLIQRLIFQRNSPYFVIQEVIVRGFIFIDLFQIVLNLIRVGIGLSQDFDFRNVIINHTFYAHIIKLIAHF